MKALQTVKLVELTVVLAIETYEEAQLPMVSAMDFVNFDVDVNVIGWHERDLEVRYTDQEDK